ncbi:unnamed protein product, partial [Amoebophrya sp. A25]|eukprot:GSA25T00011251001.1
MLHPETVKYYASCVAKACGRSLRDPMLSALHAPEFSGAPPIGLTERMPPILIQSGEAEALRDMHVGLAQNLAASGLDVTLQVFQDA